jgi:hypothetical protein
MCIKGSSREGKVRQKNRLSLSDQPIFKVYKKNGYLIFDPFVAKKTR